MRRTWQAYGPRVDAATGTDVEAAAASAVFDRLVVAIDVPVLHVHTDDVLVAASLPGKGVHRPPAGTTVYDWDEDRWGGFVVLPDRLR